MIRRIRKILPWAVTLGWLIVFAGLAVAAVVSGCTTEPTQYVYDEDTDDLSGC